MDGKSLIDYLLKQGYASSDEVAKAIYLQEATNGDLVRILIDQGIDPAHVYFGIATELGQPVVDLTVYVPYQDALDTIPAAIARRHNVLPVKRDGNILYVAMSDTDNIAAADELRLASCCTVRGVLAPPEHITQAVATYYPILGTIALPPRDP